MADDRFSAEYKRLDSPPTRGYEVAPSDTEDLPIVTRCINVASSGVVRVTYLDDDDDTSVDLYVAAGIQFPGRFKRVWSSGTTATGIVGGY